MFKLKKDSSIIDIARMLLLLSLILYVSYGFQQGTFYNHGRNGGILFKSSRNINTVELEAPNTTNSTFYKLINERSSYEVFGHNDSKGSIYVLQLQNRKYYVGKTYRPLKDRIKEHLTGTKAAAWVKIHGPVQRVFQPWTSLQSDSESWERAETLERMMVYGIDNVRGWIYCKEDLSSDDRMRILLEICERKGLCRRCGSRGHKVNSCYLNHNKKVEIIEKLRYDYLRYAKKHGLREKPLQFNTPLTSNESFTIIETPQQEMTDILPSKQNSVLLSLLQLFSPMTMMHIAFRNIAWDKLGWMLLPLSLETQYLLFMSHMKGRLKDNKQQLFHNFIISQVLISTAILIFLSFIPLTDSLSLAILNIIRSLAFALFSFSIQYLGCLLQFPKGFSSWQFNAFSVMGRLGQVLGLFVKLIVVKQKMKMIAL